MSGSPKCTPSNSAPKASSSPASARQLVPSVRWAAGGPPAPAGRRARRRRGRRRSPAWGRRSAPAPGRRCRCRRGFDERPRHDAPLHRVGVLELVDERDAVALAQGRARGAAPRRGRAGSRRAGSAGRRSDSSRRCRARRATSVRIRLGQLDAAAPRPGRPRPRAPAASSGCRPRRGPAPAACRGDRRGVSVGSTQVATSRSSTTSSTSSATSSTSSASRSRSLAIPSPSSTCWQNPWMVEIVATSMSASARASRAWRRRSSSVSSIPATLASTGSSRSALAPPSTASSGRRPAPAGRGPGRAARRWRRG